VPFDGGGLRPRRGWPVKGKKRVQRFFHDEEVGMGGCRGEKGVRRGIGLHLHRDGACHERAVRASSRTYRHGLHQHYVKEHCAVDLCCRTLVQEPGLQAQRRPQTAISFGAPVAHPSVFRNTLEIAGTLPMV
jgi:hypothetical protein